MLDSLTSITIKNLSDLLATNKEETIDYMKCILKSICEKSTDKKVNEKNFRELKPENIQVSYSYLRKVLLQHNFTIGSTVPGFIAPINKAQETPTNKSIDFQKFRNYKTQKLLSLRVSADVLTRLDKMMDDNAGIQKSYLLSYLLDAALSMFDY